MLLITEYTDQVLAEPTELTPQGLYDAFMAIEQMSSSSGSNSPENIKLAGEFFRALTAKGLDMKADYITAALEALRQYSDVVADEELGPVDDDEVIVDIVGTGGDGQNTFNVSTSSAIIVGGIPGLKVCKFGGLSCTSNSGAGDLLYSLGCRGQKLNSKTVGRIWKNNTFLFLLAPNFSRAGFLVPIRKQLKVPTVCNVLGPLLNPVKRVNKRILGVYSKVLGPQYIKVASKVYPNSEIFVVWGHVGIDEVSPIGKTTVWHARPNSDEVNSFELEPSMFGLEEHDLSECKSHGPDSNAILLKEILKSKYSKGHPIYDYLLLNTAVAYCLCKGTKNWKEGTQAAEESIRSGRALRAMEMFLADVEQL
ncbi:anthranilate phosphoribosyltransferase Ecym_5512 [Eremothecium cymbalariae DBVPG|uniref:Glycosyl transferase family 3 domain-containing protein n=1 Tax=Eremothecium cymbalariae (strain CBS 270.75 / DBVPG 7215 / KCTC 17166 / NRRL Y-17582) TaxID=931890 RepID=I6NDW2_ERECY|nr:hypothetical protein Ecym_5512 [Eremothecium cymbalariae DBVPG\